jgi:cell division protein FtsI/penicillin-binding protein 2
LICLFFFFFFFFFLLRLKKVQSKKKERAAVEDAARLQEIADAEKRGLDGKVFDFLGD